MQEGPTFEKMSEADKSLLRRSTVSSIGSHSFLDLDIYSADVHMDKIAEVFLFISLCNPLRWHEGKNKQTHSSVQYRSRLKDSRESAAATVLFRPFQSTMVLGRNEYWNASTFGVSRWYSC